MQAIPEDFPAGWQNVRDGIVTDGDILVSDQTKIVARTSIGKAINKNGCIYGDVRVYRRIPVPKQGTEDHKAIVESICQEAHRLVTGDRQSAYNHPAKDFDLCARYWSVLFGFTVKPEQVGMAMILVKLAREMHKHKRDNCTDIAGYAQCIQMVHDEANKEPDFP